VLGENIAQTLQFVQSGAAEIGVVALSLVLSPNVRGQGRYWAIPADAYPPIEQAAIVLMHARASDAAARFRAFLREEAARRVLKDYGFGLPEHSAARPAPLWSGSPASHEAQDGHHALPERR